MQQEYSDAAVVAEFTPTLKLDDKPLQEEHEEPIEVLDTDEKVETSTSEPVVEQEDNDGAEEALDSAAEDDVSAGQTNVPQEDSAPVVDNEESSDAGAVQGSSDPQEDGEEVRLK